MKEMILLEEKYSSKIRLRILTISALALMFIIFIAMIAYIGMARAANTNAYTVDTLLSSNRDLQQMQLSMGRIRAKVRDLIIYTDAETTENTANEIETEINIFQGCVDSYLHNTENGGSEYEMINGAKQTLYNYREVTAKIIQACLVNDTEAAKFIIMEEGETINNEITNRILTLSDYNYMRSIESAHHSQNSSNSAAIVLIIFVIVAFSVLFVVSMIVISSVLKIFKDMADEQRVNKNLNIQEKKYNDTDGNLLAAEFSKCISELKVIVYDLSKLYKNK